MGMYTELVCAFELLEETPSHIIETLEFMSGQRDEQPDELPDHKLFSEGSRWKWMLQSDSYYFDGKTHSEIVNDTLVGGCYVTIRCNLKNYDNEIENFIEWISPFIYKKDENYFIGYKRYEEDNEPELIFV
ncbi:hypothetical protein P5637_07065 [Bacillus paralicheniformis]|uniref:hypothetical protein n=1 Tax=Bacillus TaxID=1386 RepID=UPI000926A18C|nr:MULTISPECIES: hypothetical protein [Bacillus subtilis group]ARC67896.1 hypothetical protein B34_00453 [Bacillus licheniformis]MDE1403322.1 hypothetical protein [Bacillus licheniformis]MDE1421401.1 hypothetical protein [Bacillus licheniformis]MDK7626017.1 hypothetical protein [Bacillus licheniformis]MDQ9095483.1 hypothetical protein [Bacillus licheniformis]